MRSTRRLVLTALAAVVSCGVLAAAPAAKLPFLIYSDDSKQIPYIPSGWMGNTGSIAMDENCKENPHTGKSCLKVEYKASDNWGGVVWQSPANDWGDQPGGFDISGATKLTFWAKGDKGGEKVKFGFGVLGADKPHHDSGKGESEVTLTSDWKQYTIDTKGKDLSTIKTGFFWVVAGSGSPITFYLDDIQFE